MLGRDTRRPSYVAAPASLLAFCAWQAGDGALANVALDRALDDNPRYSMALLLREALDSGAPPSMPRLPMTPEEVAAACDAAERAEDATCESDSELAELFHKAQADSVREPRWASRCCVPGSRPDASRPSCGVPLPARPRVATSLVA
jgi:hypothetical protein